QGHDIIRTWAFYTLLRTGALTDEKPWDTILVNGMVFGPDGNKMSKSRGNVVAPDEAVSEHSADAARQALAIGGTPGSDVQFQWKEATSASRFVTKFWNVVRFAVGHFDEETADVEDPAYRDADRWILSKADRVADEVEAAMDEYRFDAALRELREFVWNDLADDYVELVKGRLYNGRPGERDAARHALYTVVSAVTRMLSPFSPFVTEEVWDHLPGTEGSVHESSWPDIGVRDEAAETRGDVVATVAAEVRAWKSEAGLPLNTELDRVEVYPDVEFDGAVDTYDLSEAVNAPIHVAEGEPNVELVPVEVDPDHAAIGPEFRERAGDVVAALEAADPADVQRMCQVGEIELAIDGETVVLDPEMVEVREEHRAEGGEEVEVLESEVGTVLIYP
ncbi:MAG: class I tRNA ligase family protein, partial [Halobacteriaceae archaeon]